ncbi:hypothetical protein B1748_29160 [Paenibacillus sp. MY03]|uniref:hypothetical protein n=1 Tax=Paenibacillus sp. MY03 TaxID=302980 RepID=UPI000B3C2280|nr:hypothetical protein [Paenibacillus sp. MY03]OUS70306.1 hypothetical protein B1748_29160 [Paenibacillus sp. MY03]
MKKMVLGIVIGAFLATAIPVAAEEINKKVTATVRGDFTVQVDGEQVELKNAPLAYDGNSYLPVRELAVLLGKDVDFVDGVIKLDTPTVEGAVISSKEDFEAETSRLNGVIADNERYLASTIEVYTELEKRPETKPEELALLVERKERYEAIIDDAKKAIADLKVQYPQYA